MAHYLPTLAAAISARLAADATLATYLAAGSVVTMSENLDQAPLPLVTFNSAGAPALDGFRVQVRVQSVDVHIYCPRVFGDGDAVGLLGDGFTVSSAIIDRICGDWADQSFGTGPTYGLDRWQPNVGATGWTAGIMTHANTIESHIDETLHFTLDFKCMITRVAV